MQSLHCALLLTGYVVSQMEEERLATVERDNRILMEKMSFIMRTKGRVDNVNDYGSKRYVDTHTKKIVLTLNTHTKNI